MRATPRFKIILAAGILAVAVASTLVLVGLHGSREGDPGTSAHPSNGVWKQGTSWVVKVPKDNAIVAPDRDHATRYVATYRFRVTGGSDGRWDVHVTLDGAEGPYADGYRLQYREQGDAMVLAKVAIADQPLVGAEHAQLTLGSDFPLEVRYTEPPQDRTLEATPQASDALPPELPSGQSPPEVAPPKAGTPPTPGN